MKFWKSISERSAFATGNFVKLFGKLEFPSLPQVAVQLLEMTREEGADIDDLTRLISTDAGLSAKILQLVNSAHFGLRHRVTDIKHALVLAGSKRIQSVALAFSVMQTLPTKAKGFDHVAFWQDSLQRALFAETLAPRIAPNIEGEAFTGALMQNMVLPILLNQWESHYLPIYDFALKEGKDLEKVEDEKLSWNHSQASAWMARNWNFPDVLVCCIGLHHATIEELDSLNLLETPAVVVAASSRIPDAMSFCCEGFGITDDVYLLLCEQTDSACEQLAQLFGIPSPRPLVEHPGTEENDQC